MDKSSLRLVPRNPKPDILYYVHQMPSLDKASALVAVVALIQRRKALMPEDAAEAIQLLEEVIFGKKAA